MVGDKRSLKENIYSLVVGFVPGADLTKFTQHRLLKIRSEIYTLFC